MLGRPVLSGGFQLTFSFDADPDVGVTKTGVGASGGSFWSITLSTTVISSELSSLSSTTTVTE